MIEWTRPADNPLIHPPHPDCGNPVVDVSKSELDGTLAKRQAWPWVAFIRFGQHVCAGALLDEIYLLAAAHCIHRQRTGKALLGMYSYATRHTDPHVIKRTIARVTPHQQYDFHTRKNDIVLLKMDAPVNFTDHIRPICLPTQRPFKNDISQKRRKNDMSQSESDIPPYTIKPEDDNCYIAGWSNVEHQVDIFTEHEPRQARNSKLHQLQVWIMDQHLCYFLQHFDNFSLDDRQLCLDTPWDIGTCGGESGGPLVCLREGRYYLMGLLAYYEANCNSRVIPDIVTNILGYLDWIKQQIVTNS